MWSPADWGHPVSGTREFGFEPNGRGGYTFYTRGVDRMTNLFDRMAQPRAFDAADNLWSSLLAGIESYVESNGGSATVNGNEGYRPDWNEVEDMLTGQQPVDTGCTP
jgi:hypothetical protein